MLGGDACGFPNGRRLTDDVVETELLAVAGAAYPVLDGRDTSFTVDPALVQTLTDGLDANDRPFLGAFPYLAAPHSGQDFRPSAAPCPDGGGPSSPNALQCFTVGNTPRTPKFPKGVRAAVEDAVDGAKNKRIQQPHLFCTSAAVNDQGDPAASDQLVCFTSKDDKRRAKFRKRNVQGTTPLGDVSLTLKKSVETCVPATGAFAP